MSLADRDPTQMEPRQTAVPQAAPQALIEMSDLHRGFGRPEARTEVLRGLALRIEPGSFTVIRGPSGAGKTTLLRILGLLDQGYEGRFALDGQDLTGADPAALDQLRTDTVGFVFQEGRFLDHLTLGENIALPLRLRGTPAARLAAPLADVAGFVFREEELAGGLLDIRPAQASGGQRQRAALARALITGPRLILADEPTASLDAVSRAQVVERLQALHQTGATIIVVSHDPVFFDHGTQLELVDGALVPVDAPAEGAQPSLPPGPSPEPVPLPGLSAARRWRVQLGGGQILAAAITGIVRRPLLSLLTLVSLVAGICQVAILASLLGGVDRVVEQAVTDGSRLTRVAVRPRTADLQLDDRFPLRDRIAELVTVTDVVPRRTASFSVVMPNGSQTPYPSMGVHPGDPELRFFQFLAGAPDALAGDDFGLIGTTGFLAEVLRLDAGSGAIDWEAALGQPVEVVVPRFDRSGQKTGEERVRLRVAGVILSGEGSRQFYVSNRMLLATDAIRRDRTQSLELPLTEARSDWRPGAEMSALLDWPWEDMLHIYLSDMDSVLPGMTELVGLGYRPEAEIWDYLWILDLKEAALRIFVPMLGLLVVVISLVLVSNVYVSARLRRGELALCRVLGLGRGDLLATEILSLVLLAAVAVAIGLVGAQGLIDLLTAQFRARAELLAGLPEATAGGVSGALFSPVSQFAPQVALATIGLVVAAVLWPSLRVARTDPALVFTRG